MSALAQYTFAALLNVVYIYEYIFMCIYLACEVITLAVCGAFLEFVTTKFHVAGTTKIIST